MKRKIKNLHQITDILLKRTEEHWTPKLEGLESLKVNRDVPRICILLSKDPLPTDLPGYQPPTAPHEPYNRTAAAAVAAVPGPSGDRAPRAKQKKSRDDEGVPSIAVRHKRKRKNRTKSEPQKKGSQEKPSEGAGAASNDKSI